MLAHFILLSHSMLNLQARARIWSENIPACLHGPCVQAATVLPALPHVVHAVYLTKTRHLGIMCCHSVRWLSLCPSYYGMPALQVLLVLSSMHGRCCSRASNPRNHACSFIISKPSVAFDVRSSSSFRRAIHLLSGALPRVLTQLGPSSMHGWHTRLHNIGVGGFSMTINASKDIAAWP